jgi:hypothetical protein
LSYSSIVRTRFAAGAVLQFVAFREVFRVLGDFKLDRSTRRAAAAGPSRCLTPL